MSYKEREGLEVATRLKSLVATVSYSNSLASLALLHETTEPESLTLTTCPCTRVTGSDGTEIVPSLLIT